MTAHNPYVAWMYQKYGELDPTTKTVIDCFDQMKSALGEQAYLLSLILVDRVHKSRQNIVEGSQAQDALPGNAADLIRPPILARLLQNTGGALATVVKDAEKVTFVSEALEYHVLGRIPGRPDIGSTPSNGADSQSAAADFNTTLERLLGTGEQANEEVRLLQAFAKQVDVVASDVVRQVLFGEAPPVRRVEDSLAEPRSVSAPATGDAPSDTLDAASPPVDEGAAAEQSIHQEPEQVGESAALEVRFPIHASMMQRFGAYLADYVLIYFIVVCVYFVAALTGSPLSSDDSGANVVAILALWVYMTIAQLATHTTVGKYLVGVEVISELPDRKYPTWGKLVLRETIGRLCSFLLWGAGYWTAIRHPQKQAWSDRMAGTMVVARKTTPAISKALGAFVCIALLVDIGVTGYGYQQQEKQKQYAAVSGQLKSIGENIESSRKEVERLINADAPDFPQYQGNMRSLSTWLDRYDAGINQMQTAINAALRNDVIPSAHERQQMQKLLQVWDLRKQQSTRRRDEIQIILDYVPSPRSASQFKSELEMIDSDINSLEQRAAQLVSEIQQK